MEMGFDEKEVLDALRVNNNQQNAAVSTRPTSPSPTCQHVPHVTNVMMAAWGVALTGRCRPRHCF